MDSRRPWCYDNSVGNPALEGCTGTGRPECTTVECMYGVEPCPMGNHFKPVGAPCNFTHQGRKCVEEE